MKLFVTGQLPETMLSLICLESELDKLVLATSQQASQSLNDLGIPHQKLWSSKSYSQEETDGYGYKVAQDHVGMAATVNGYNVAHGMYPDRLRFWFSPAMRETKTLIEHLPYFSEVYIETNFHDRASWSIADSFRKRDSKIVLVKSDEAIYDIEFSMIDMFDFSEILVSNDRDVSYLSSITSKPVRKISGTSWDNPKRRVMTSDAIKDVRTNLNIPDKKEVTGIVYTPQDDWKLLALFNEKEFSDYILFFNNKHRTRFFNSISENIRNNSMYNFDGFSLMDVCTTILFPRYMNECNDVPSHIRIVFYDFNNMSGTQELIEKGVI